MTARPLTRRALLALALAAVAGCAPAATVQAAAARPTTVLVVRHAERAAEPAADPGLTPAGQARAEALPAAVAGDGPVAAIYTTQLRRTRDTAAPLGARAGVPVTVRPVDAATAPSYAADLARHILQSHRGQTVVVVGHSNTVPGIVAALGGEAPPAIADSQYGDLFRVVIPASGPVRVERARFGG
jgi:broad specificity phosphatase PhoE